MFLLIHMYRSRRKISYNRNRVSAGIIWKITLIAFFTALPINITAFLVFLIWFNSEYKSFIDLDAWTYVLIYHLPLVLWVLEVLTNYWVFFKRHFVFPVVISLLYLLECFLLTNEEYPNLVWNNSLHMIILICLPIALILIWILLSWVSFKRIPQKLMESSLKDKQISKNNHNAQ